MAVGAISLIPDLLTCCGAADPMSKLSISGPLAEARSEVVSLRRVIFFPFASMSAMAAFLCSVDIEKVSSAMAVYK